MNYKALYEKQKELYQHAIRIPRSLGEWDAGMMTWKDKRFKLESEISALEQQISKEVSYPREFVEWYVVNCLVVGDHFCKRTFDYEDLKQWNTLEEVFEYWQSKVKNKKP